MHIVSNFTQWFFNLKGEGLATADISSAAITIDISLTTQPNSDQNFPGNTVAVNVSSATVSFD